MKILKLLKPVLALLLLISTSVSLNAQFSINWKVLTNEGYDQAKVSNFASVNEAKNIIDEIVSLMGIRVNFEVREANIPNAAAVFYNNKRYILYNPGFIRQINRATKTDWASISILAHEIGHHVKGHMFSNSGNSHKNELEADAFSGLVLRKMGASLAEAQAAMNLMAGNRASATHPGKTDRLKAIAKGWNSIGETSSTDMAKRINSRSDPGSQNSGIITKQPARETVLDDRHILVDVNFSADKHNDYFVTVQHNVVKWDGNNLSLVGRIAQTKNPGYPYYIYDSKKNFVFVSRNGYLVDQKGKRVGYLSMHTTGTAKR